MFQYVQRDRVCTEPGGGILPSSFWREHPAAALPPPADLSGCFSSMGAPPPSPVPVLNQRQDLYRALYALIAVACVGGGGYLGHKYVPSHPIAGAVGGVLAGGAILFVGTMAYVIAEWQ